MNIPDFNLALNIRGVPDEGDLKFEYGALQNKKEKDKNSLTDLNISADAANINIDSPVEMMIEEAYDGSANIIINDKVNPVKLVNSRFYITENNKYKVGDREGNIDTNIYSEDNFITETSLVKSVQSIIGVDFLGVFDGGQMPVGNYTFYFKLSDADGNESDFIAESGRVVCYIGNINQPKFIRGGQFNENSGKSIKFTLKNLDIAYNYISVYYTRSTGDEKDNIISAKRITDKFKITGLYTTITITGYEIHEEISVEDINIHYAEFNSTRTVTNCQNMTFSGNTKNDYSLFKILKTWSLAITPQLVQDESIGNLNHRYDERLNFKDGYEYYNASNIYYKLGYWNNEIYRFGIVYIMNDYTLSPVFNIMGIKELTENINASTFSFNTISEINAIKILDDYSIEGHADWNAKGVIKINYGNNIYNTNKICPIAIKFNFPKILFDNEVFNLSTATKGFFIVRQKRIPTILAQGVAIGTTKKGNLPVIPISNDKYIIESFLNQDGAKKPRLGSSIFTLNNTDVIKNALICPEADLRTELFNSFFDSSEYVLQETRQQPENNYFQQNDKLQYYLESPTKIENLTWNLISAELLLIEPGIETINNNIYSFSSRAGEESMPYKTVDVYYGDFADPSNQISDLVRYNNSVSKIRGEFNTYIGSNKKLKAGYYYDIYQKGYSFEKNWKEYFKLRMNDPGPYFPISDRTGWNIIKNNSTVNSDIYSTNSLYRGDCYICTYTHRMNWNFIDSDLPTNTRIVDLYTWYKNYRVKLETTVVCENDGDKGQTQLTYKKLLPLFTYKSDFMVKLFANDEDDPRVKNYSIISADSKAYKKYAQYNGEFGYDKINKTDVNSVGLGTWITFKICSNVNLSLRDVDLSRPQEEAIHKTKRSFYPLKAMNKNNKLPESRILNSGISKTSGDKYYFDLGDIPFIKTSFTTRIYYSNILQQASFINGNRIFLSKNYVDYSLEYGGLVKLVEWYGALVAVMEHGILYIPVNERALVKNEIGDNVYINTDKVLPSNPRVVSNMYGSVFEDSIVKTSRYIYGIDTTAKKIWRTDGTKIELISDLKIQKYLNDHIKLYETDTINNIEYNSIKTHYNAFKSDVLFVFNYRGNSWHFCWNELLNKWVTRYSWFPEFSENINNIFYTFANTKIHKNANNYIYKHGAAGTIEEQGNIQPTYWYKEQHAFELEFIVAELPSTQKIFNNLKIVSNNVQPESFIFEIIGDGYEWGILKDDIVTQINGEQTTPIEQESPLAAFGEPFNAIF